MMTRQTRSKPTDSRRGTRSWRAGITLVEVTISTLLVGVLVVASLQTVSNISRTWITSNEVQDGRALAQDLLREILAQNYADPTDSQKKSWGPETGETNRTQFNDLDDYVGWTESPVKNAAGTALTGYTGWTRTVVVQKINTANYSVNNDISSDTGLRCVAVTVTAPSGKTTVLKSYRSYVGGTTQTLSADATVVTWVGCTLQLGANAPATTGVSLSNHAEDQ